MIGDSSKTIAIILAIGFVLAATSTLFIHEDVSSVPLKARDVGRGWSDNWKVSPRYPSNWTVADNFTYSIISIMSNKSSVITLELLVFKSPESGLRWMLNETVFMGMSEDAGIGDVGYIFRYGGAISYVIVIDGQVFSPNPWNLVTLMFIKGNILSKITFMVKGIDTPIQPWMWDSTLELGVKQLHKIDRYLASNPEGAD
jgi:hypothetical protein